MTHYCLTLGGANYARSDNVGRALYRYASTNGRTRKVVEYSQAMNDAAFDEGLAALHAAVHDLLARSHTLEILASSLGAEITTQFLYDIGGRADAPDPARLRRVTLIGNACGKYGGAGIVGGWFESHGFNGKRPPTPSTPYLIDNVARKNDGWANADGWWGGKTGQVSKARLMTGRVWDHVRYDNVSLATAQLRVSDGNTRYWVHA